METDEDMRQQEADEEGARPAAEALEEEEPEEAVVLRFFDFDPLEHSETVSREQLRQVRIIKYSV